MFYNTSFFIITHNVSSDQSPITTNRTNVTLYGVRPGETYTVEILPYPIQQASLPSLLQITSKKWYKECHSYSYFLLLYLEFIVPENLTDHHMNSGKY